MCGPYRWVGGMASSWRRYHWYQTSLQFTWETLSPLGQGEQLSPSFPHIQATTPKQPRVSGRAETQTTLLYSKYRSSHALSLFLLPVNAWYCSDSPMPRHVHTLPDLPPRVDDVPYSVQGRAPKVACPTHY